MEGWMFLEGKITGRALSLYREYCWLGSKTALTSESHHFIQPNVLCISVSTGLWFKIIRTCKNEAQR
jgi:hypothetical protein